MSDMIDGLSRTAIDVGQEASHNLTEASALAVIGQRVAAGRRRRRIRAGAIVGGALVMGLTAAVVVPRLDLGSESLAPADSVRSVVSSVGNLTVFDDGSMSLYTQRGTFVDLPPVTGGGNDFSSVSAREACAFDPTAMDDGWEFHVDDARQVLLFARPQAVLGMTERRLTRQGEFLGSFDYSHVPYPAFTMDAEVATAPQIALRETVYDVYLDDTATSGTVVKSFATLLEASPKVTIAGDADSLNRVATVEARATGAQHACDDALAQMVSAAGEPYQVRRYLLADIFLLDRDGHSMLLATHTSWTTMEVQP